MKQFIKDAKDYRRTIIEWEKRGFNDFHVGFNGKERITVDANLLKIFMEDQDYMITRDAEMDCYYVDVEIDGVNFFAIAYTPNYKEW